MSWRLIWTVRWVSASFWGPGIHKAALAGYPCCVWLVFCLNTFGRRIAAFVWPLCHFSRIAIHQQSIAMQSIPQSSCSSHDVQGCEFEIWKSSGFKGYLKYKKLHDQSCCLRYMYTNAKGTCSLSSLALSVVYPNADMIRSSHVVRFARLIHSRWRPIIIGVRQRRTGRRACKRTRRRGGPVCRVYG